MVLDWKDSGFMVQMLKGGSRVRARDDAEALILSALYLDDVRGL